MVVRVNVAQAAQGLLVGVVVAVRVEDGTGLIVKVVVGLFTGVPVGLPVAVRVGLFVAVGVGVKVEVGLQAPQAVPVAVGLAVGAEGVAVDAGWVGVVKVFTQAGNINAQPNKVTAKNSALKPLITSPPRK